MTTKIDSINNVSIGEAIVGTVMNGVSILAASTGYVNNFVNNLGLALNQAITYSISGTKTFSNDLVLTDGLASGTTSIGIGVTTVVNLLSSSVASASVVINGFTQSLQVSGVNTWSRPIIVAPDVTNGIPHSIILSAQQASSSGTRINFTPPFSVGCIPRVFICSQQTGTQLVVGAYNVDRTGFNQSGGASFISWFAVGY
jgi:hypothetical protein